MNKLLSIIIVSLSHILYRRYKKPILYIKGTGKEYPRYMLYTEDVDVYKAMENF